ncbi:hypothetical protein [Amycolatopsis sp. NPDC049159]|uniref:NACHT domain-containing protein n=1 Tax=Amycolatopsis sp. NPDC049159 TaxID=3157210 RepID=UPI0033CDBAE0
MAEEEPANVIAGEVTGQAVQVGSVHGDMYVGVPRAVPRAVVDPPAGWDDLPSLPGKIVSLLRAQIENAEIMPYRLRGARRPSLSTVYVRQDVTTGSELQPSDQARPLPVLDSKGRLIDVPHPPVARLTVRPPSRTLTEALDGGEHMLVTGGPGQGKSTLSLQLAADVARHWQESDGAPPLSEPVVPLRLTARELAARLDLPFFEALADTVRGEYGAMLDQPIGADDLVGRVAGCRWLLLVDGLDEVADTAVRDRLVTVLAVRASDAAAAYRVILTTRPIEGATLAPLQRIGAARYELLPFDEAAFRLFAENWFSDSPDEAKKFIRQVRDAHLDELVRVPLLATIAAIIFDEYADRPLPDNQYELYETYLDFLRSAHPTPASPFDECRGRLIEHLGRVRLEEDTSLITAACRWVTAHLPELGAEADWRDQLITQLAGIGPFLRRSDDLGFLHHSFAEHLAATAKARQLPETFDPSHREFVELLHAAEPEERGRYARRVLLHYTRLHPAEADCLTRFLHDGGPQQHLLAARLLAWHLPASKGDVDAFLATARAWAATTQYPGGEILAEVSRAAHHPGLVGWLQGLMRDGAIPWPSRVEAAVALATRLGNESRAEAVETLRTVVHDATIEVQARLDAAEALSQCGDDERSAAIFGLESVLDSPEATVAQCGDAAVVLAGLGAEARVRGIAALITVLDDPRATDPDLVAAAVSLLEIDVEFHERCASVFRMVLRRRSWASSGVEEAARGLASLGPERLAEAAAELELRIADFFLHYSDRFQAARVLMQLGPQYRVGAGELVLELATGPAANGEPAYAASVLAGCGPEFHGPAVSLVRAVLSDPVAGESDLFAAGWRLVDLGPDHWPDAASALGRAVNHPLGYDATRINAMAQLAKLGEPHRELAVDQLRFAMKDPELSAGNRCSAAAELLRLGPEFHAEAAEWLIRFTRASTSPSTRVEAWRQLSQLNPEMEKRASAEILDLVNGRETEGWVDHFIVHGGDVLQSDELVDALEKLVSDAEVSGRQRNDAAVSLSKLHYRHHAVAARGFARLIRDGVAREFEIKVAGRHMSYAGVKNRQVVADVFRNLAVSEDSRPSLVCVAAGALGDLDSLWNDEVIGSLRKMADDYSVDAVSRCNAVVLLARNTSATSDEVVGVGVRLLSKLTVAEWESYVKDIAAVGVDLADEIHAMMADRDTPYRFRQQAAVLLAEMRPALRCEAIAELQSQANDPFFDSYCRTSALRRLATADPSTASGSVELLQAMMLDERTSISRRSDAAYELAAIEQSGGEQARRTLLGFAASQESTPWERGRALGMLAYFHNQDRTIARLRLALAHDPAAASGVVRAGLLRSLLGKERRAVGRAMVLDRLVSPANWPDVVAVWEDSRLAVDAERELIDRLAGPEPTPAERIDAIMALSRLSPAHETRAVELLENMSRGGVAISRIRKELATLTPRWRRRVLADARTVLFDSGRPGRERALAGLSIAELTSEIPEEIQTQMADLLGDERIARRLRLRVLIGLRRLDALRSIRDDQRVPLLVRRHAATELSHYSSEDRSVGAALLRAIAADAACHPMVRCWAAHDLAEFGVQGCEWGAEALKAIMVDETLPVSARQSAARELGLCRPDLRGDVLALLRRLAKAGSEVVRISIWKSIGSFEPGEGAAELMNMAHDRSLGPVVRRRSAWAAARLHRGYREDAAVVAREISHDAGALRNVRVSSARLMAATSELCRPEARELIDRLRSQENGPKSDER